MSSAGAGAGDGDGGGRGGAGKPGDDLTGPPPVHQRPGPKPESFMNWTRTEEATEKRDAPSAGRNAPHILAQLQRLLSDGSDGGDGGRSSATASETAGGAGGTDAGATSSTVRVLEVASGTGQHALFMANGLPRVAWQPSEYDEKAFASIAAYAAENERVLPPVRVDASAPETWGVPAGSMDAVFNANMIHISPWACTEGLFAGAARVLRPGGLLVTYGPYKVGGECTTDSNAAFDESLRARNGAWGIRDVADVAAVAAMNGIALQERVEMPANNFLMVWRKGAEGGGSGAGGPGAGSGAGASDAAL